MKVSFLNGQIVADGYLHEDVPYDVSANNLSVCFDGKGGFRNIYPFVTEEIIRYAR